MARIVKQDAGRFLVSVPEENVFRCCDGRILRNMYELSQAFSNMGDEIFAYHSNTEKNDFSKWVRDVIKDEELAMGLAKSRNQSQAAKAVADRMSFFKKQTGAGLRVNG